MQKKKSFDFDETVYLQNFWVIDYKLGIITEKLRIEMKLLSSTT